MPARAGGPATLSLVSATRTPSRWWSRERDAVQRLTGREQALEEPQLSEEDPVYFVVGPRDGWNARFQLSFKYRLFDQSAGFGAEQPWLSGFYFGYTQTSLWDLSSQSKPFRDTSYRPSFFWRWDAAGRQGLDRRVRAWASSTSRTARRGENSRTINTAIHAPRMALGRRRGGEIRVHAQGSTCICRTTRTRTSRNTAATSTGACATTPAGNGSPPLVARTGTAGKGQPAAGYVAPHARPASFGPVSGYLHLQYLQRLRREHPRLQRAAQVADPDRARDRAVKEARTGSA